METGKLREPKKSFASRIDAPQIVTIIANTEEKVKKLAKWCKLPLEELVAQR